MAQTWIVDLHKQAKVDSKVPVEVLAKFHNIALPRLEDLPPSYTLRHWVTGKIATLQGKRKAEWQQIRSDPAKMQQHREASRIRMQLCRRRGRNIAG